MSQLKKNYDIRTLFISFFTMKLNRSLLLVFALVGMLPPLVFRAISWYHGEELTDGFELSKNIFTSVMTTVTISVGVVQVMIWLQKQHPWSKGITKRLFLEVTLTTLTAFTLITLLTLLLQPLTQHADLKSAIFKHLIVALILNFVLVAITEGIFFFNQWTKSTVEAERFKKESIRAQLESLKNQVNPHFLFNSLNTLSSLIDHDKDMSKEFLDDLSSVYRYVLQHKDEEIVTLKTELDFIKAFTQLLKKRHGNRIAFHFNISENDLQRGIPPMTLQLLVENAVKHNIASRKKPLIVEVFSQNGCLLIRNNLQLKKEVESTGIGLENIRSRYQYLVDSDIEIINDEKYFTVKIPIIELS